MSDDPQVYEFFEQYEDLACAVIDDDRPNLHVDMEISNSEMTEEVCRLLGWPDFDLFDAYDFQKIYERGSMEQLLAYFYIAHLRLELFTSARIQRIGDHVLNQMACSFSEYWYLKLRDRYDSLYAGRETKHDWMH